MLYDIIIKNMCLQVDDVENSISLPYIVKELNIGTDYELCHKLTYDANDIILDLGANIGLFSIMMARLYPQIKIYAFEALEINYKHLVSNINRADVADRVFPFHLAVTGDGRDVVIGSPPNCTGGAALHLGNYGTAGLLKNSVKSITLTDIYETILLKKPIKLLKIDVEGSEFEILKSTDVSILKQIKALVGEFHWIKDIGEDHHELLSYMENIIGNLVNVRLWGTKKTGSPEDWW